MTMESLVWLLPAASPTHYELLGQILESHLDALSSHLHVWGMSWNPVMPGRFYTLQIWNARGRLAGFHGRWRLPDIMREMERLWAMEGFQPTVIIPARTSWSRGVCARWRRKFGAVCTPHLPFSSDTPALLGVEARESAEFSSPDDMVCLWIQSAGADEAAYIADLLALQKYQVYALGTPRGITALRNAAARFPSRIHLRLGLPWIETQLYMERARAVIWVGAPFNEGALLRAGCPWILPSIHPLAAHAQATYRHPEDIPALIEALHETPLMPQSAEKFVQDVIRYVTQIKAARDSSSV